LFLKAITILSKIRLETRYMHTILATWDADIGKTVVPGQPRQIVQRLPSPK
jgi:hypothetical protein